MHPVRSSRARTAGLLICGALLVFGFAGCAPEPGDTGPGSGAGRDAGTGAGSEAGAGAGALTDLSNGGECRDGQDVTIAMDDASAVLSGSCGRVEITGNDVRANIDAAAAVVLRGDGITVLGERFERAEALGANGTLNVDDLGEVTVEGDGATVINQRAESIRVLGSAATLNGTDVERLSLDGRDARVVLTGELGALELHGDDNRVSWRSGVRKPDVDTGSGNAYERG